MQQDKLGMCTAAYTCSFYEHGQQVCRIYTFPAMKMERRPQLIPPLVSKLSAPVTDIDAWHAIQQLDTDMLEAQDDLLHAKIISCM